jgi:serine/threonine protein kinase
MGKLSVYYDESCSHTYIIYFLVNSKPADIWSAGVLLHLLVSGTLPFLGTKDRLYNQILDAQVDLSWNHIGPDAKDLISNMLHLNPDKRLTIQEVLAHPWLKVKVLVFICHYNANVIKYKMFFCLRIVTFVLESI